MSFTTPLYIPLVEGLDNSQNAALGGRELQAAENIDFSIQGEARGRPSRGTPVQFQRRTSTVAYAASSSFAATGLRPNGLMRLRDSTDERPMLGTDGHLFALEGELWRDRGAFASMRVDQPHVYLQLTTATLSRGIMGPDFGNSAYDATLVHPMALLDPATLGFEREVPRYTAGLNGTMAKCGTTTATVFVPAFTNNLTLLTRANGAETLTSTILAADASLGAGGGGEAPCIVCDHDQTVFFIIYKTTVANQYKVLRVTTGGVVSATYTGSLVGLQGVWVANSLVAGNFVVVGVTNAAGLTLKVLNATAMTDNAVDSTHGTVACDAREVVVGVDTGTRAWWAYRQNATAVAGMRVGTVDPTTAATATSVLTYASYSNDATRPSLGVDYYTPLHAPVKLNGRMYLSMAVYNWVNVPAASPGLGTWFTLDLNSIVGAGLAGAFTRPTLVARGRTDSFAAGGTSAAQNLQPEGAILSSTGWTFPSKEWRTYNLGLVDRVVGESAVMVLNRVAFTGPRAVLAGGATMFSGSVPRVLAGDECLEAGFPLVRPTVSVTGLAGGGTLAAGSYTAYACWAYTDGAGQVHRSAPSGGTVTVNLNDTVSVFVQTPYITERTNLKLEIYCTSVTPATGDPAYLQASVSPSTSGSTLYSITAPPITGTRNLYTLDGEFVHVTPSADGGIAVMGRRVWVADRGSVYASLLMNPNEGVAWNDEGSLQVDLPAGAGRVVSLEALDSNLVIFCERGVYIVPDGGPNNVGQGPDVAFPIRLTDLGCAGPRSTCVTDRGVVFCSPLDTTDPQRGGPWLLDRSLSLTERKYLGTPALDYLATAAAWVPDVAFSYERQQLYVSIQNAAAAGNSGVLVVDMRQGKWSTWYRNTLTPWLIAVIDGCLWSNTEDDEVAGFTGAPGADDGISYAMLIKTAHLSADGRDGLGWSRVRAITPQYSRGFTTHNLTITATQDQMRALSSGAISVTTPATDTTWPTTRGAPEWRLPSQKCSSLQVTLSATPATARWAAIRLDVQPIAAKAPAKQRS